jgi:hypothetical protein
MPGARLYRTGDLARYFPDGTIEFLGRVDNQIKIRGLRIELGEIEAVLSAHETVRAAVVLAREDTPGEKRLAAYLVAAGEEHPLRFDELRGYLRKRLPEYMIPSAFVVLETFPLTPNGKVDRRALPAPDRTPPQSDTAFAAPRSPVEEALVDIWREVIGLDRIGIHDNFFELGGHSLLATRVLSKVRAIFSHGVTAQSDIRVRHHRRPRAGHRSLRTATRSDRKNCEGAAKSQKPPGGGSQ